MDNYSAAGLGSIAIDLMFAGAICIAGSTVFRIITKKGVDPDKADTEDSVLLNRTTIPDNERSRIISGTHRKKVRKIHEVDFDKAIGRGYVRKFIVEFDDRSIMHTYARNTPTTDGDGYLIAGYVN